MKKFCCIPGIYAIYRVYGGIFLYIPMDLNKILYKVDALNVGLSSIS